VNDDERKRDQEDEIEDLELDLDAKKTDSVRGGVTYGGTTDKVAEVPYKGGWDVKSNPKV